MRADSRPLSDFLELVPFAAFAVDGQSGHVILWNQPAEEVFGWTKSDVVGKKPQVPADHQSADLQAILERAAAGERIAGIEAVWVTRPGSRLQLAIWISSLERPKSAGRVWLVFAQDVTPTKRLEQQLFQAQKMDALGRLAGGLAHDLNNLHTVIAGYGSLMENLLKTEEGSAAERTRSYTRQILAASERATKLLSQLLAFSRRQAVNPETLNCNLLIQRMEPMLRRLIGENIELTTKLCPGPATIRIDPAQFDQALMNLVVNARDAMPEGGTLAIATELVRSRPGMSVPEPGNYVRITVSDTGVGMEPEVMARIFEPFFTTKERGKGTGLGLSIVFGVVKQSDGELAVHSEPGAGTRVEIYFPVAHEANEARPEAPAGEPAARDGRETILLVEDEAALRKILLHVLQQRGYGVLAASNGQEALQVVKGREAEIDLLVTDVLMPKMNGPQLAKHLLRAAPGVRVLFTSAHTDAELKISAEEGAFLQKPFTPDVLAERIRQVLGENPRGAEPGKRRQESSRRSRRTRRE